MPELPQATERIFIALGSNLGDRAAHITAALDELGAGGRVRVVRCSRLHETEPVGGPPGQPKYLNAVAELRTGLEPAALLERMQRIETAHGRARRERWGPRTLDLDLLLFGFRAISTRTLTVPHPRMWQRPFVLKPLAEICDPRYLDELRRHFRVPGGWIKAAGRVRLRASRSAAGATEAAGQNCGPESDGCLWT